MEDNVTAVEHQQACKDQDEDPQSKTSLKAQTKTGHLQENAADCEDFWTLEHQRQGSHPLTVGLPKQFSGEITCFIPHGMLSIDVPIIVFHTANLGRAEESSFRRASKTRPQLIFEALTW